VGAGQVMMMSNVKRQTSNIGGAIVLLMAGVLMAAAQTAPTTQKDASRKSNVAPARLTLPPGAVMTKPGTYRYTDAQGTKWIYRQTPFGLARFEEQERIDERAAEERQKVLERMTATEDGDFIHFTKPGPFGTYKWKQKKTELDELEQAAWDRERARKRGAREKE
jgi:hypothetical protein